MKRYRKVMSFFVSLMVCGLLFASITGAQDILSQQQKAAGQIFLSLDEAIRFALENNLEIAIEQYNPEIKNEDINNAKAAFQHQISADSAQVLKEPSSAQSPKWVTSIETGITKRLETGGSYQVGLETSRADFGDATATVSIPNPTTGIPEPTAVAIDDRYDTSLKFTVSHAMLKNRGRDINTTPIVIAQKNREVSISQLRSKVINIVSQVKNTYWRLIYALGDLEAKRLSLRLAYDLVKINEAQVEVGMLAPIEILQAKATAAAREVEIISAEKTVRDVEDELKRLLNFPEDDPAWTSAILPTDTPISTQQPISLQESLELALENREELKQLQKALEISELSMNVSQNQLKPELNLLGTVALSGSDDNLVGSLGELPSFDTYSFTIGANFSYPLGNIAAKSALNKAKLGIEQTKLSIQNLEQLINVQIMQAVRAVETSYRLVEATKIALQLAQEQLDAEQKKFNEGLSTNFQVLNYQDSLATARSRHTQSITSYNQALVALDQLTGTTLQQHNIVVYEE